MIIRVGILLVFGICQPGQIFGESAITPAAQILNQLLSPNEAERFKVIEEAKKRHKEISFENIRTALKSSTQKNVSTLIFVLIETGRDDIYRLNLSERQTIEKAEGSFPNIAYYYARVNPEKGIEELFRLYDQYSEQMMFVCKAIGEVGTPKANNFLLNQAISLKKSGKSIYSQLAGLSITRQTIKAEQIGWFLEQKLDREEIIKLARLKTDFDWKQIVSFYHAGKKKRFFATEYILGEPDRYFEALRDIVDYELKQGNRDSVLQIMMSDSIRNCPSERVREYRKSVLPKS